jgi:hypothetical protein
MNTYRFSENNSGGSFWLTREQYERLFEAGWTYEPDEYDRTNGYDTDAFLDNHPNPVPYGWRRRLEFKAKTIREAVESFEAATGEDFFAEGCNCCGAPFSISNSDDWTESLSGDDVSHQPVRPW